MIGLPDIWNFMNTNAKELIVLTGTIISAYLYSSALQNSAKEMKEAIHGKGKDTVKEASCKDWREDKKYIIECSDIQKIMTRLGYKSNCVLN